MGGVGRTEYLALEGYKHDLFQAILFDLLYITVYMHNHVHVVSFFIQFPILQVLHSGIVHAITIATKLRARHAGIHRLIAFRRNPLKGRAH
jgi:hypothetical protein